MLWRKIKQAGKREHGGVIIKPGGSPGGSLEAETFEQGGSHFYGHIGC